MVKPASKAMETHLKRPVKHTDELIEIPSKAGERHEPVIQGKGVPVWVLVSYAVKRKMSPQKISRLWSGHISPSEVRAALAYWRSYPEMVEDKLSNDE